MPPADSTGRPTSSLVRFNSPSGTGLHGYIWPPMFRYLFGHVVRFPPKVWILCFGWFVGSLGFATSIPFISIYFHSTLGMTPGQIGLFFAGMAVIRGMFQAAGGEGYDRLGSRQLLIFSQLFRVVAFLGLGVAVGGNAGLWPIALSLFFVFVLGSVFISALNATLADLVDESQRLDAFALGHMGANLGWAIGPAISSFLAPHAYSWLFYFSASLTFGSSLVFAFFLRGIPKRHREADRFRMRDIMDVRHDKRLLAHALLTFLLQLVISQLIVPLSLYATTIGGYTPAQVGILFTINGSLVVALQIVAARLAGRWPLAAQLWVGSCFYFFGYAAIGWTASFWQLAACVAVVSIGEVIVSPAQLALTSRLAPPGRTGRYMGVYGFFQTSAWSLGPVYGTMILEWLGKSPVLCWLMISSLALFAAIGYALLQRALSVSNDRTIAAVAAP